MEVEVADSPRNKYVSQVLVVIDDSNDKPTGIVTECDLVRKVCVNDTSNSSSMRIKNIASSSH
jgi:signal-transduction protein with cAMP-binding, CBS, and nucleotidyltransferase domain